jgi:quercetin dioxygenase-like cupin family protein
VEVEVRRGEVVFFEPEAHATANVGGTEVHVLMVEPK